MTISNIAVLTVYSQTYGFGGSLTEGRWKYVDDGTIITIIGIWSKILEAGTVLVAGWALSQIWARYLYYEDAGGTLAGLRSLGLVGSIGSLFKTVHGLFKGRYRRRVALCLITPVAFCAIVLQFYATAVVSLAVPTLYNSTAIGSHPMLAPFMTDPIAASPCKSVAEAQQESCLSDLYVGNALTSIFAFTQYSIAPHSPEAVGLAWPWQPKWQEPEEGGRFRKFALICDNDATTHSVVSELVKMDAYAVYAHIPTVVPILSSQCTKIYQSESPITQITIADTVYEVLVGIRKVPHDHIAAQVTTNDMTLVITVPSVDPLFNTHCAVNLSLPTKDDGSVEIFVPLRDGVVSGQPYRTGNTSDPFKNIEIHQQPINTFADVWLKGMGWSAEPSPTIVSKLGNNPNVAIRTNYTGHIEDPTLFSVEAYSLVIMANAVSQGFSFLPENGMGGSNKVPFQYSSLQYYIGARTTARLLSVAVVLLDMAFILWCVWIIIKRGEWLPDWSDPVALVCTGVSSSTIASCTLNLKGHIEEDAWEVSLRVSSEENAVTFVQV